MSQAHDDTTDPSAPGALLPALILAGLLLLGVAKLALIGPAQEAAPRADAASASDGHDARLLAFAPLRVDDASLRAAAQAMYSADRAFMSDPKVEAFIAQARQQHDHMFTTQPIPSRTVQELSQAYEYHLGELLTALPKTQDLMLVADLLADQCAVALARLQAEVATGAVALQVALRDPDPSTWSAYRQACGDLLKNLHELKLVDDRAQWLIPDGPALARVLQRHRFAASAVSASPLNRLLPSQELTIFWRWRIESRAFSPTQRLDALRRADKSLLPYPWLKAQAIIELDAGQPERALKSLNLLRASAPQTPHLDAWIASVR